MKKNNTFRVYYADGREVTIQSPDTLEQFIEYYTQEGKRIAVNANDEIDQIGQLVWHVFSDNWDAFYPTEAEGHDDYDRLVSEGRANVRLYWEVMGVEGDTIEEDHVKGIGEFPW